MVTGIGNLGPLIADNLPYGVGNDYLPKHSGPPTGDPGPALSRYLTQRNDNLTRDVASRPPPLGKTIVAYHRHADALLVGVQPDGTPPGQSSLQLRDALRTAGFSDAVFADGSDSAMLWYKGRCIVRPGEWKDELMVVGLGFAQVAPAPPAKKPKR